MKKVIIYIVVLLIGAGVFVLQFDYREKVLPTSLYQVYLDDEIIGVIKSKDELEEYISSQGELVKEQVKNYSLKIDRIDTVRKITKKNKNYYSNYYENIVNIENIYNKIFELVDDEGNLVGKYDDLLEVYSKLDNKFVSGVSLKKDGINNYDKLKKNIDEYILPNQKQIIDFIDNKKDNLKLTSSEYSSFEDYIKDNLIDVSYTKYVYMKNYVEDNIIYLNADNIYKPLGINIKKISTYNKNYDNTEDVYTKIIDKKPCTIDGYQFKIKKSKTAILPDNTLLGALSNTDYKDIINISTEDIVVYVTEPKIFNSAIDEISSVFIGNEEYEAYKNNQQKEIQETGTKIENVYLNEEITIKETNISVKEKIFDNSSKLASYLLYGENQEVKTIYANSTDSITDLAYKNGITVEEFFLSNPTFTSINNIFYDNQPITISKLAPKLSLVVEEAQVLDKNIDYKKVEKYDDNMIKGNETVEQKGSKGLMRVSQNVKKVNGSISYVEPVSNETIKAAKDEIVLVGTKEVPNVGSTGSWGWPTNSGYTLTSYFGWRSYPFNPSRREFHAGLDIAGTGYGSPIYASNNGTIEIMRRDNWNYGTHIIINHNNGYWTTYGHMSGFASGLKVGSTVSRGQVIGYMGHTGAATGTHLHFEIRVGANRYSNVVDPLPYLRK